MELPVLVHEPGHGLGVGADVRCRHVARRPEHLFDLVHERARDALKLSRLELARVAVDAAFGAAEWNADYGGLPGHQHRQRTYLVEVDLRVVANASLVGTTRAVVLNPEPVEHV